MRCKILNELSQQINDHKYNKDNQYNSMSRFVMNKTHGIKNQIELTWTIQSGTTWLIQVNHDTWKQQISLQNLQKIVTMCNNSTKKPNNNHELNCVMS